MPFSRTNVPLDHAIGITVVALVMSIADTGYAEACHGGLAWLVPLRAVFGVFRDTCGEPPAFKMA